MSQLGELDFAGGTVIHVNAGVAGLVLVYLLGNREGYKKTSVRPASVKLMIFCLLYTSPSPRDGLLSRMPSSA